MTFPPVLPPPPLAISTVEIIIAVVFVVGGIIKHFMEQAAANKSDQPTPSRTPPLVPPRPDPANPAAPRSLETAEEKRARKLMEALGMPGGQSPASPPPPPVMRSPPPPPPPPFVPPPFTPAPPPLPPRLAPPPPPLPPADAPRSQRKRKREAQERVPAPFGADSGVDFFPRTAATIVGTATNPPPRGLLRLGGATRGELRRAILLREVLGPPRALVEAGEPGSRS